MLPEVVSHFRIVAFITNQFSKKLLSDIELFEEIVLRIRNQKGVENTLVEEIEERRWSRKNGVFKSLSSTDISYFA